MLHALTLHAMYTHTKNIITQHEKRTIPQTVLVLVELHSFCIATNTFEKDWAGTCDRPGNRDVGWWNAQG